MNLKDNIVVLAVLPTHKDSREGQIVNVAVVDLAGNTLLDALVESAFSSEVIQKIKALIDGKTVCAFDACSVVRVINNTARSANLNPLFAYNDVKCVMTDAANRYDYAHDYITLALACKHANVKQILPANNALNNAKSVAAILNSWNQTITVRQSYDDDIVVIKDTTLDECSNNLADYTIRCKIKLNQSDWFDYKIDFRDKGYEPFDGFDPEERARLFKFIECNSNGNTFEVAHNLIDDPLSDFITDYENAHDGVGR